MVTLNGQQPAAAGGYNAARMQCTAKAKYRRRRGSSLCCIPADASSQPLFKPLNQHRENAGSCPQNGRLRSSSPSPWRNLPLVDVSGSKITCYRGNGEHLE
ncbi:hypothetical protein F4W66_25210 (plasmid) [Escherichia coli]|nr:hypothetical protein F4W66_25210 [Escherichia coli]